MALYGVRIASATGGPMLSVSLFANDVIEAESRIIAAYGHLAITDIRCAPLSPVTARSIGRDPELPDDAIIEHDDLSWSS